MHFVKLTSMQGKQVMVNAERITELRSRIGTTGTDDEFTRIYYSEEDHSDVKESFEEILAQCQPQPTNQKQPTKHTFKL